MANDVECIFHVWCETEDKLNEIEVAVYNDETENDFDFERILPEGKWGTKWSKNESCIEMSDTELEFTFTTAWNAPYPVIQEFCKKFGVRGTLLYYDRDDFGSNCGYMIVDKEGEVTDEEHFDSIEDGGLDFIAGEYGMDAVESEGWKMDENGKWEYVGIE